MQSLQPLKRYDLERQVINLDLIEKLLSSLMPREQKIIKQRWGLDGRGGCKILKQIALEEGVSASRIRNIEMRALRKMKTAALCKLGLRKRPYKKKRTHVTSPTIKEFDEFAEAIFHDPHDIFESNLVWWETEA